MLLYTVAEMYEFVLMSTSTFGVRDICESFDDETSSSRKARERDIVSRLRAGGQEDNSLEFMEGYNKVKELYYH